MRYGGDAMQVWRPDRLPRQRASHRKSKVGCLNCRQRHVKCDEVLPTCLRCFRRGDQCQRPLRQQRQQAPNLDGRNQSQYQQIQRPSLTIPTLRDFDSSTPSSMEIMAMEYFYAITLPTLRAQHTSSLWGAVTHDLMRTSTAFREILVAMGAQQARLEMSSDPAAGWHVSVDALYGKALYSFRRCMFGAYREQSLVVVFGTVLLAILEALRGSLESMMVHMSHGVRLVLELQSLIRKQDEAEELALLLHRYCATLLLFCDVPDDHVVATYGKHKLIRNLVERPKKRSNVEVIRHNTGKKNSTRLFSFLCSSAWES